MSRLPVALIGAGARARSTYGPLLRAWLAERFDLVGVIGRGEERARALGEHLGVPWSARIEDLSAWGARAAVVCVSAHENAAVAHRVLDLGLGALLETPLALALPDAERLAERVREEQACVEIAEQNPRFPEIDQAIRAVRAGLLGPVGLVASEGAGYRYHGAAVARALLGRRKARVATAQRVRFELDVGRGTDREELLVGTIRVEGGAVFTLRDGEAAWVEGSPWSRGGWRALGSKGQWADGAFTSGLDPIEPPVRAHALPDGPDEPDLQAAARCLLDLLARREGTLTPTAWSADDAWEDLRWIDAMERSARLGGAPIAL